ncbi:MAG TPA: hypothetical protein PLR06_13505, partial [Cyclobacteriaceae bacterium]|nr:hypothetical protein [Cyclobacteriaceae bacterium]
MRSAILIIISILLIGGGIFIRSQYSSQYQARLIQTIQNNLETEFGRMEEEAKSLMIEHLQPASDKWDDVTHFFIHADSARIITWNRNFFLPGVASLESLSVGKKSLMQTPRGDFLILKWKAENSTSLYGVVVLTDRYPISNSFLSSQTNPVIFPLTNIQVADPLSKGGYPIVIENEAICRVLPENVHSQESIFSFILVGAGFAFFLFGLWSLTRWIQQRLNFDFAFLALLSGLVAIR